MQSNAPLTEIPSGLRAQVLAKLLRNSRPDPDTGCIEYTGPLTEKGYGKFIFQVGNQRTTLRAHRAMWIFAYGPISDASLVIDHLCRNRACMNPFHLELVTNEENIRRGDDHAGRPRRNFTDPLSRNRKLNNPVVASDIVRRPKNGMPEEQPCCVHGHAWPENLQWWVKDGEKYPICRQCNIDRKRRARSQEQERQESSCANCAQPVYLTGLRWRHVDGGRVACEGLGWMRPRLVAVPTT